MFKKLEQRSWIKIEVARCRSIQEFIQGLREACGDTLWYTTLSFFDYYHRSLAPLALGDSHPIWVHAITISSSKLLLLLFNDGHVLQLRSRPSPSVDD